MAHRDKLRNYNAPTTMRIGGEVHFKPNAKRLFRCAECLGELEYWNAGLKCKADKGHNHFVHKKDVPEIQAMRQAKIEAVEAAYEIVDGLLRPRKELI
jgi:hypothetical protein